MTSKLNDPKAAPKTYWSILNHFLCNKKIPSILLLLVNKKLISDFRVKANFFNDFFASICMPINNGSILHNFYIRPMSRLIPSESIKMKKYLNKNDTDWW